MGSLSDTKTKSLQLLHCFKKHKLTSAACKDVLKTVRETLKDFLPPTDCEIQSLLNYDKLLSHIPPSVYREIYYCAVCESESIDNGISRCNCQGKLKSFVIADVKSLLSNLLKIPEIVKDILKTKHQLQENVANSSTLTDIHSGKLYKETHKSGGDGIIHLTGTLNTDGVNLYSSSRIELWPIFIAINELSPELRFSRQNLLLLGLWQGKGKPPFKLFLSHVCQEINSVSQNGVEVSIDYEPFTVFMDVLCITMDLPAKAAAINMTLYNGSEACISCEEIGVTVKQGRGHCRSYPYRTVDELPIVRSHETVLQAMTNASINKRVKGFKGISSLSLLRGFDLVRGIVPDYMHAVLLGIVKTILQKWFSSTESKKDYFVGNKLKTIAENFFKVKPPHYIERLPRDLEKNYAHFKATELQTFLLFYALPCLHGIHKEKYLQHFALLSEAIFILLGDKITDVGISRSKYLLEQFYKQFADLYSPGSCGLNVHNVCRHLPEYVENLGPLWCWSCFAFEDGNSKILKSVHGTGNVVKQAIRNQDISMHIRAGIKETDIPIMHAQKMKVTHVAENCEIFGSLQPFKGGIGDDTLEVLGVRNRNFLSKVQRVCVNGERFYSAEYSRMKKRICHAVLYFEDKYGLMQYFVLVKDTNQVYAILTKMVRDTTSWLNSYEGGNHLIPVKLSGDIDVVPVEHLVKTLIFLNIEGGENAIVGQLPNTQGHAVFK